VLLPPARRPARTESRKTAVKYVATLFFAADFSPTMLRAVMPADSVGSVRCLLGGEVAAPPRCTSGDWHSASTNHRRHSA